MGRRYSRQMWMPTGRLTHPLIGSIQENMTMASDIIMNVGEALVGEGNEIAHIDLLIGSKTGPVGTAFANALANQSAGHSNLLAVLTPNLLAKPATVLITKVTIKGMKQAVQMFGPAQYAVAKAVADSVADGTIPASSADDLVIVCGVFIHPAAEDNAKILKFNYEATKLSITERHGQAPVRRLIDPIHEAEDFDSARHRPPAQRL
jgi:5,6,7,8-tetrahydromethanopterin hydro-lyase